MPAFVVEDGTGLLAATSYISVADADDYLSIKAELLSVEWTGITTEFKEDYLMWATRLLDQRARWAGQKTVTASPLQWPRSWVCDRNGLSVDPNSVPSQVEAATVEIAYHLAVEDTDPAAPNAASAGGIKRLKADVLEIEYQDNAVIAANYFPVGLNQILSPLGAMPGGGSGFARVIRG